MKTKEHLSHFNIAGFTYYEGSECFQQLVIGTELRLELEPENKYDARAVAIYFKEFKLGFVPRSDNRIIYKLLTVGLDERLTARVQAADGTENPERQIQVVVHLLREKKEEIVEESLTTLKD